MGTIFGLMADENFTSEYMPYLHDDGNLVLGSFAEAVYALRSEINVEELLGNALRGVLARVPEFCAEHGYAFVAATTSVIPLPPGYTASRYSKSAGEVIFAVSGSFPVKVSFGATESRAGGSILIFGVLGQTILDRRVSLDTGLRYLNDVLTSYRIVRHDHGVQPISARQLPGVFDCYPITFAEEPEISAPQPVTIHYNDKMDVWAKRSLLPVEYKEFLDYCEGLVFSPEVRYLLNLAITSIDDLCLGQFESAVLNSDRFMELALRLCYLRHPDLPDDKLGRLTSVYSTNPRVSTLLSSLAPVLGLDAGTVLEAWAASSRRLRNAVAHKLDFSVVTPQGAHLAVEYNLALVQQIAHKFPESVGDVQLLGNMIQVYEQLFGRQRPPT
ncbi:hypothetical protein ACVWZ8_004810 [Arthrobacter sp. UYCu723]